MAVTEVAVNNACYGNKIPGRHEVENISSVWLNTMERVEVANIDCHGTGFPGVHAKENAGPGVCQGEGWIVPQSLLDHATENAGPCHRCWTMPWRRLDHATENSELPIVGEDFELPYVGEDSELPIVGEDFK